MPALLLPRTALQRPPVQTLQLWRHSAGPQPQDQQEVRPLLKALFQEDQLGGDLGMVWADEKQPIERLAAPAVAGNLLPSVVRGALWAPMGRD